MSLTNQVNTILNAVMTNAYGGAAASKIDTTDLVSTFNYVSSSTGTIQKFLNALYAQFGGMIFNSRAYERTHLPIWKDSREFAAMMLKVYEEPITAEANQVYAVADGDTAGTFTVKMPDLKSAIIEESQAWECPITVQHKALADAFKSEAELAAFIESRYINLENSMSDYMEKLEKELIATFVAVKTEATQGLNCRHLVTEYNTKYNLTSPNALTAATALDSLDFLVFANQQIAKDKLLMTKRNRLYNTEQFVRFTPYEYQKLLILNDFVQASETKLQANTYHNELVKLPGYFKVPYWEGVGTDGAFDDVSKINLEYGSTVDVSASGLIAVLFDDMAIGATIRDRRNPTMVDNIRDLTQIVNQAREQQYIDPSEQGIAYWLD